MSKTIIFLEKYIEIPLSPRLSFFLKRCLTWLGKNYDPKNIIVSQNPDLEEIYYLKFLGKRDIEIQLALSSPTVKELYFLAELAPEKARDFIDYVKKAQNPDGGFGFFPGTTSFLENTYYAFFFLKKFDENPIYLKELKHFLFSCFRQGGFARAPQGVPFLESTYFGTSLLVDGNIGTIAN
ncbi:hypothetical protein Thein_2012 [Thermodesulfatator indicus DSM 15286]|uniref:Prenyltransferase alpha-alpha toroid domain-containing protein n=1 Tax=Thermodesulfatator indicus (strain DSM 15286 / JCM 11887 / CIR29812) TaxID=667014 RepID=F8ACZ7_THEID|nr:hypothetical protein Thein_2012 [Thermodesulfatator indicus DSM 15286]